MTSTKFLGFIIDEGGIHADASKVAAISKVPGTTEWHTAGDGILRAWLAANHDGEPSDAQILPSPR